MNTKHLVLGVDAAWTTTNPSGVALISAYEQGWTCLGLAPSYSQFEALSKGVPVDWNARPASGTEDFASLLTAASRLAGDRPVTLICVDMPLSKLPIRGRRVADRSISQEFGHCGCSTHSPTVTQPGKLADKIRQVCENLGFELQVEVSAIGRTPALIEVYPHPALLALMQVNYRFPYKVSKSRRYWPNSNLHERKQLLWSAFSKIRMCLASYINGISLPMSDEIPASLESLKQYEDALDALICAWVGSRFLEKRCRAYGDAKAAIWVPYN